MSAQRKNISLVTWFGTPNYGTTLQAFALYRLLQDRGFNIRIIRRFTEPFTLKNIKDNCFYALGIRRFWKYPRNPFPVKTARIRRFCRERMRIATVCTAGDLRRLLRWTDVFVAGSDQLWNCHDHFRSFELLGFAPGRKKISYATSIGTQDIPVKYQEKFKEYLSDFQHISIRERSGALTVARLTGREDIAHVLDPVLLAPLHFWEDIAAQAKPAPDAPYVLWYVLRQPKDLSREAVRQISLGRRIIIVPSGEAPGFTLEGATVAAEAGIPEFLSLLQHASLVVTDSFHGTALSIAFSKPFIHFKRFADGDAASQNIRIRDLLDELGIADCTWSGVRPEPIDYEKVHARLAVLRAQSSAYLDQALSHD